MSSRDVDGDRSAKGVDDAMDVRNAHAWRRYAIDLADRLAALPSGEQFAIPTPFFDDHSLIVVCSVTGAHRVRVTIGNADQRECAGLAALGWRQLANGTLIVESGRRRVDALAALVVGGLRDVFGLPHPAFLAGDDTDPREPAGRVIVATTSAAQLQRLVDRAVEQFSRAPVEKDEDGDIPLPTAGVASWLRVRTDEPTIEVFSAALTTAGAPPSAAALLAHNARWPRIILVWQDQRLQARMMIEATAFSADNLRAGLARWFAFVHHGLEALANGPDTDQIGTEAGPGSDDAPLPGALLCLMHLDTDGGELDAQDVARICEHDRDAILDYQRICTEQALAWEESASDAEHRGDADEAQACLHEMRAWERTGVSLREALRVTVLGPRRDRARAPRRPSRRDSPTR